MVGEIADDVVVMRNGEIREQGPARRVFENPQDAYTKALLQCRPQLDRRPTRLPVIDDYMDGSARGPQHMEERVRGTSPADPDRARREEPRQEFLLARGPVRHAEFEAVKDVSFKLRKGKTLGLVGESGSGKTTVGLTLMRLHEATTGEAIFEGRDLLAMSAKEFMPFKRRIQIIFQNPYASLNPRFTIGQILIEPMQIHGIGDDTQHRTELAFELLQKVGLPEVSFYKYPHEFSGGQRQRIAIARCLTMKPDILICDESVSALDVSVQAQVLNLLQDLQDEFGLSYIFISHDLAVVKYISDEIMVMSEGKIVEIANSDEVYRHPREAVHAAAAGVDPEGLASGAGRRGGAARLSRRARSGSGRRRARCRANESRPCLPQSTAATSTRCAQSSAASPRSPAHVTPPACRRASMPAIAAVPTSPTRSSPRLPPSTSSTPPPPGRVAERRDAPRRRARDAKAFSADGFTALHFAAFFNRPDVAALLIARGADVDAVTRNPMRVRPLHSAATVRASAVVAALLAHGADPNAPQEQGATVLMSAAAKRRCRKRQGAARARRGRRRARHRRQERARPRARARPAGRRRHPRGRRTLSDAPPVRRTPVGSGRSAPRAPANPQALMRIIRIDRSGDLDVLRFRHRDKSMAGSRQRR